jgi:hypothetical protein
MTKPKMSMPGSTQTWDARAVEPSSRRALAARSLRLVNEISDSDKRRQAFAQHMAQFEPLIGRPRTSDRIRCVGE